MRKKIVGLYDPYLDTFGGGEKHILSIIKVICDNSCQPVIFWDKNTDHEIKNILNLDFETKPIYYPNFFKSKSKCWKKIKILSGIDYFFYVSDGSYFFSPAKKNYVFLMVPDKNLFKLNVINKFKTFNYKFITNSLFTQKRFHDFGLDTQVIYPYLESDFINLSLSHLVKEKIILSVGRFFKHLHSKRQDLAIKAFKKLKKINPIFSDYKLILVGGLKKEDQDYINFLQQMIGDDKSISIKTNLHYDELFKFYQKSAYYWHFTGYSVDEKLNPEKVEHLGISPLEAMASGCITFCHRSGGPTEFIHDGENGFLFKDIDELISKITNVETDKEKQEKIKNRAKKTVDEKFSYDKFKNQVLSIL
jgi:glycosyltransferase involved in cell wall biosynthesis